MSLVSTTQHRLGRPPRDIGGANLAARGFTVLLMAALTAMGAWSTRVSYPALKISLLVAAELGLVAVMVGLFLRLNTYFAGLQVLAASMAMLWLASRDLRGLAVAVGLVVLAAELTNVVTRRSRLNKMLDGASPEAGGQP